ncbi:MAG: sigma-70 family RNA polymerase sigma factor [Bacteroidales bacterium]|nr:sigma-70 family RNA polymerase sigma factor [Bacteroidales bacterium]
MSESIQDIINKCLKGDRASQEKLYREYAGKMWVVCRRYARDTEQAKDILQEGFVVIFEKIHQFKGKGSFEGWMRRIFINLALAEYRKKKLFFFDSNELPLQHDELDDEVFEDDDIQLTGAELLELIASLPTQYRMVFNLYAIEEMSHKEIANMLGISEGTSKSNLFRAREWLRKKIAEKSQFKYRSKERTLKM